MNRKSLISCLLAIMLLAGFLTACGGEQNKKAKSEVYWNVERELYSETGRTPNAEGYYEILMLVNGEQTVVKTKYKLIADQVDSREVMGLGFDDNGNVKTVYEIPQFAGEIAANWDYVKSVLGNVLTCSKTADFNSEDTVLTLSGKTKAYLVDGGKTVEFDPDNLEKWSRVLAVTDAKGKLTHLFVRSRHDGYGARETCGCENTEIQRLPWDGTQPIEDGKWYTLSGDVTLENALVLDGVRAYLCLNGHTLQAKAGALTLTGGANITVCDHSEARGKILAGADAFTCQTQEDKLALHNVDVTVEGDGAQKPLVFSGNGQLYGENCTLTGTEDAILCEEGSVVTLKECTVFGKISNMGGKLFAEKLKLKGETVALHVDSRQMTVLDNVIIDGQMYVKAGTAELWNTNQIRSLFMCGGGKLALHGMDGASRLPVDFGMSGTFAQGAMADMVECFPALGAYTVSYQNGALCAVNSSGATHTEEHCLCGGSGTLGNHSNCKNQAWKPMGTDVLTDAEGLWQLKEGAYYLTEDLRIGDTLEIPKGVTVTLCLNGCNIYGEDRVFLVKGTLNICDCREQAGKVCGSNGDTLFAVEGTLNLYGGICQVSDGWSARVVTLGEAGVLNIYEAALLGNDQEVVGNGGLIYCGNTTGTVNIYGGRIAGGKATLQGGNIYTDGILNLLGGVITEGMAGGLGSGVAAGAAAKVHLAGKPMVENNVSTVGAFPSNLYLSVGTQLTFGELKEGALVSISAIAGTLAENVQKDVTAYLKSDVKTLLVKYRNKSVILERVKHFNEVDTEVN